MKKIQVPCWRHHEIPGDFSSDLVYYTIPRHSYGYHLMSCTNCGEIYAYDVMAPFYIKSLEEILNEADCVKCGKKMSDSSKPYPDFFLNSQRNIKKSNYVRAGKEQDVIKKEFWDLYS